MTDQGVSAVVGTMLMLALTVAMAAIVMGPALEMADSAREAMEEQTRKNRVAVEDDEVLICETRTRLDGTEREVCWTEERNGTFETEESYGG